jgi:GntR family transcriptional regulator / MocR family aminotransferase
MGQFPIDPNHSSRGGERRIYSMLRAQIEDGTLAQGAKLASTRALAMDLGVSRTTVTAAYEQLAAEGFVVTATGKAARVASGLGNAFLQQTSLTPELDPVQLSAYGRRVAGMQGYPMASPQARIDFRFGAVASREFPSLEWQRIYRAELLQRKPTDGSNVPQGEEALRRALQGYLRRARGLICETSQIMIVHGSQQGLDLCARLLLDSGDTFIIEDPGYRMARHSFEATGACARPLPVDTCGLVTELLPDDCRARLAYVTPSHQFPTGAVLSMARRQALLHWAREHRTWIIEDDYGGEFRYGQRPIDALQTMDTDGRVIYLGTFSKALSPQLRLGYLVLPKALIEVFQQAKRVADRLTAGWDQNVLASLIENGTYERHVRRLRRENERRRAALLAAHEEHLKADGQLIGMGAGLHGVLLLPRFHPRDEFTLQRAALEQGVGVYPMSPLFAQPDAEPARCAALILGYAGLTVPQIQEGIRTLAQVLKDVAQKIDRNGT